MSAELEQEIQRLQSVLNNKDAAIEKVMKRYGYLQFNHEEAVERNQILEAQLHSLNSQLQESLQKNQSVKETIDKHEKK